MRVAIVGLGSAGAAAAALCAERGLDVVAFDRTTDPGAGACWVNGVPRWAFEASGVGVCGPC